MLLALALVALVVGLVFLFLMNDSRLAKISFIIAIVLFVVAVITDHSYFMST